jgi:hypothetical protein
MRMFEWFIGVTLLAFSVVSHAEDGSRSHGGSDKNANSSIPPAIQAEHKELHEKLRAVTKLGGRTGSAANDVEKLLKPHFVKEEQLALPPLGLLTDLSAGRMPRDGTAMIRITDDLKREMLQMLAEHKQVVAALQRLQEAAQAESKPDGVAFAKTLTAHATLEEHVFYPSALLVGRYLSEKKK